MIFFYFLLAVFGDHQQTWVETEISKSGRINPLIICMDFVSKRLTSVLIFTSAGQYTTVTVTVTVRANNRLSPVGDRELIPSTGKLPGSSDSSTAPLSSAGNDDSDCHCGLKP